MKKVLFFLMFLSSVSMYAQQHELTGRVIDKKTGAPIVGAQVESMGVYNAETDYDGSFTLKSMVPLKSVKVTAPGMNYKSAKAHDGMTVKMSHQTIWNAKPDKWSPFVSLQYMIPTDDEFSLGIMAGIIKKHGFYVKGMYSPSKSAEYGEWNKSDEGKFTGKHSYSVSTIGVGYMYRVIAPLNVYAGGGYMSKTLSFERNDGKYIEYDGTQYYDYANYKYIERLSNYSSAKGFYAELGFMGVFNHIIVNAGCMLDIAGKCSCGNIEICEETPIHVHIGVGYKF